MKNNYTITLSLDPYSMLHPAVEIPASLDEKFTFKIAVDWKWTEQSEPEVVNNFKVPEIFSL